MAIFQRPLTLHAGSSVPHPIVRAQILFQNRFYDLRNNYYFALTYTFTVLQLLGVI